MSQSGTHPTPDIIGGRILTIVRDELEPAFAAALVRTTASTHGLDATDEELAAAGRALPAAAAGHPVEELPLVAEQPLADRPAHAAGGRRDHPRRDRSGPRRFEPCAVAGTDLILPVLDEPAALISTEYVTAAGVLAVIYQYGDRIGFFEAVRRAVEQLDGDELCLDCNDLLNQLYCWDEIDNRIKPRERARLVAKILGLRDPHLSDDVQPDPVISGLFDAMLDAINVNCDPGVFRDEPTSMDAFRLESAVRAVQLRLSWSMTGLSALRVRDLQIQFDRARDILDGLAPFVRPLCRPAGSSAPAPTSRSREWESVGALLGAQLLDGSDLVTAAATARAWEVVFSWVIASVESVAELTEEVCDAAAMLRPDGWRRRWDQGRSSPLFAGGTTPA
jgi:hypothetical protein